MYITGKQYTCTSILYIIYYEPFSYYSKIEWKQIHFQGRQLSKMSLFPIQNQPLFRWGWFMGMQSGSFQSGFLIVVFLVKRWKNNQGLMKHGGTSCAIAEVTATDLPADSYKQGENF